VCGFPRDENRIYGPDDSYDRTSEEIHSLADVIADVSAMVLRDRNHPSVIWWSLCNEQGCQTSPDSTQPFAAQFAAQVKYAVELLDSTRPVTAGMNHLYGQGTSTALDVQGFNYNYDKLDAWHAANPLVPVVSSETAACTCARGVYLTNNSAGHLAQSHCVDEKCLGGTTLEDCWSFVANRQWMHGGFYCKSPSTYTIAQCSRLY
jgi:beta-galactosidase